METENVLINENENENESANSPVLSSHEFEIIESVEKLEDLLARNHLFVDYFNEFLQNPGFGEKLRFNFASGELELIGEHKNENEESLEDYSSSSQSQSQNKKKLLEIIKADKQKQIQRSPSTAEVVRKNLESQLKSIIRSHSTIEPRENIKISRLSASSSRNNKEKLLLLSQRNSEIQERNIKAELFKQIDNHSFRDINLIKIQPFIDPSELKDVKAAAEAKIPIVRTNYIVDVLKKPFCMKWLRTRRLGLFLQSEFYNEFKLAALLSQYKFTNDENDPEDNSASINEPIKTFKYVRIEVDRELIETGLNPFNAKNDFEKLQEFFEKTKDDNLEEEEEEEEREQGIDYNTNTKIDNRPSSKKSSSYYSKSNENFSYQENNNNEEQEQEEKDYESSSKEYLSNTQNSMAKKLLIENDKEFFQFLKEERPKKSLLTLSFNVEPYEPKVFKPGLNAKNSSRNETPVEDETHNLNSENGNEISTEAAIMPDDDNAKSDEKNIDSGKELAEFSPVVVKSAKEMAKILVDTVMHQSLTDIKTYKSIFNESYVGDNFLATDTSLDVKFLNENFRYRLSAQSGVQGSGPRNELEKSSTSQLTNDKYDKIELDERPIEEDIEEYDYDEKIIIDFEDEPYELSDSMEATKLNFRRNRMEEFKDFLKENEAYIFYKLWIDIEKLNSIFNKFDQKNYLKQLKSTYNRPQLLNRLNKDWNLDSLETKNKYYEFYSNYEKNNDFWSIDSIKSNLQKRVFKILVSYWWPKFCLRMSKFKNYADEKYPYYSHQQNMLNNRKQTANDLDAENIEKSMKNFESTKFNLYNKQDSTDKPETEAKKESIKKKTLPKVKLDNSPKLSKTQISEPNTSRSNLSVNKTPGLEGYALDDFKTSPPVGWKRPASTTTLILKQMIENKQRSLNKTVNSNNETSASNKSNKLNKEIYFEAIYREDVAGQIFLKYLINKTKSFAVNRLKCIQQLIKYKDLFYDENFNRERAKYFAFEIYSKYIAVSANYSIDCPKSERLKLHQLFSDSNLLSNIGGMNAASYFRPVYEDTFDSVEEFLLNSLYDDWKVFMEAEDSYFNHNEIEKIERSIKIRSKKIDELLSQGLIKMIPGSAQSTLPSISRKTSVAFEPNSIILSSKSLSNQNYNNQISLKELINNTRDLEMFKTFLDKNNSLNDIFCWMDIEAFTQIDPNNYQQIDSHARMLKRKYLNKKYFFSKNGPANEEVLNDILEKVGGWNIILQDRPPNLLIKLVKAYLESKIKNHWLPMYNNSEFRNKSQYSTRTQMMDVVDDVLFLKNRTPVIKQYSKIKKQRWLYSSQVVINFGKAIRNSFTTKIFKKFLELKESSPNSSASNLTKTKSFYFEPEVNNNLVNDLQFLVDVQDYKDLYQKSPENEKSILFKMNNIIDCYINNRLFPKKRIDIPEELAHQIMEKKDYLSPYLFLEAHLIIFNILMPYWIEFNQMRSAKDLEIFDEFNEFKKPKDLKLESATQRVVSARSNEENQANDDRFAKWRHYQYIKALKTQLVL